MRILEPSQKKLPSLEAERTAGVMADCLHQVELLAMLPSVLQNLDRLSPSLSEELGEALSGHRLTVERVDQAEEAPTAELDKEFRSSLKNVLRLLRDRPADLRAVRGAAAAGGPGRSDGMQGLIGGLQGLHRILVQRLLTGPGEERQRARFLQDLAQRHANNLGLLALLEEKVAAVTRERDAEVRPTSHPPLASQRGTRRYGLHLTHL